MDNRRNPATTSFIQSGDRLPAIDLASGSGTSPLHAPELGSPALLFVRAAAAPRAAAYIRSWATHLPDLISWYGRPMVITEAQPLDTTVPQARAEPGAWDALGIAPDHNALIVADRWGMVYLARQTTRFTDLPDAAAIEEWLRFLATQCPECGVIDEPGYGEWAP